MVQPSSKPHDTSADSDFHGVLIPDPLAAPIPTAPGQTAGSPTSGPGVQIRTHAIGQGVVLEILGALGDVVEDLDEAIQLALADGPRSVICDLSAVHAGAEQGAIEMLASAGRHVRDWPGIPVAIAHPDPQVRAALAAHSMGAHLIVKAAVVPAISAVLATPLPSVKWLRLAPHPTAASASRNFVTRTLLTWGLAPLISSACLVVSELVTNSTIHARTDIHLSLAWSLGAIRLTVRDDSPDLPKQRYSEFDVHGRGLSLVIGISRAFGVLPTACGGKVVWAVLNTALPCDMVTQGECMSNTV